MLHSRTSGERAQAPCLAAWPELAGTAAGAREEPQGSPEGAAEEPRSSPGEAKPSGATSRLRRRQRPFRARGSSAGWKLISVSLLLGRN